MCRSAERYTAENNATKWDELQCFDAVGWAAGRASDSGAARGGRGEASPLWVDVQNYVICVCAFIVMELLRITRQIHCKAVEQRATLIHRQYNREWGTSYSRPPIDTYLTSPLFQNPAGATGIRLVKPEWWGAGVVICLKRGADLHTAQLMPLPFTVSSFSKIQIGFTFLVLAYLGSPGQRAIKWVCVCVT